MSRWIDRFENTTFQDRWATLKEEVDRAPVSDETVGTSVKELARLRKVIAFIDQILDGIDPELVPIGTWDAFDKQAAPCLQQLQAYNSNLNISHVAEANAHADNLLTYVRPYMLPAGKTKTALNAAVREYARTLDEHVSAFGDRAGELIREISEAKDAAQGLLGGIQTSKNSTDEFIVKLFGGEDSDGINQRISELVSDFEEKHREIDLFYTGTLIGDEWNDSIKKVLLRAKESILQEQKKIVDILEDVSGEAKDLEKFHTKLFGKPGEDGKKTGGLSGDLDERIEVLSDFEHEQQTRYKALNAEIESLLPGATTAGLASAYRALRRSFSKPIRIYSAVFYATVSVLFLASLIFVVDDFGAWYVNLVDVSDLSVFLKNALFKLPLIVPIIWLAVFSSRRRSEAHRLQQEYAHKEAIAKSYQSFKKQVQALGEKDNKLLEQLLGSAIKAIAYNASATLDKRHGDDVPTTAKGLLADKLT